MNQELVGIDWYKTNEVEMFNSYKEASRTLLYQWAKQELCNLDVDNCENSYAAELLRTVLGFVQYGVITDFGTLQSFTVKDKPNFK